MGMNRGNVNRGLPITGSELVSSRVDKARDKIRARLAFKRIATSVSIDTNPCGNGASVGFNVYHDKKYLEVERRNFRIAE